MDYSIILIVGVVIAIYCLYVKVRDDIVKEKRNLKKLNDEIISKQFRQHAQEVELKRREEYLQKKENEIQKIVSEESQRFPYLADTLAEWRYLHEVEIAEWMKRKKNPAVKAAEQIRLISKEKRIKEKECQEYKNQLMFYESLFPWLEEFRDLPPKEAYYNATQQEESDEYERVKNWLSPEEYSKLTSSEKWQVALDRFVNRKNKTSWDIGIEYERFIGYIYESKGNTVYYGGAINGLDDRGRDIIVDKGEEILVIQCKRWSKEKTIHEKHIMQLFGSVAVLNMENKKKHVGVFVTTTTLSETAKYFAELLDIKVVENYEYRAYPLIKCNISKSGEKIYHLPFDQQYDRIHIDYEKGNKYVYTTEEAEKNGFRHAHKWRGENGVH